MDVGYLCQCEIADLLTSKCVCVCVCVCVLMGGLSVWEKEFRIQRRGFKPQLSPLPGCGTLVKSLNRQSLNPPLPAWPVARAVAKLN